MPRLHIFKPGRHIATNGQPYEFTEAALTAIATAYNPQLHEAPLVVGHPQHDDPAYGWVKSLAFADGRLQAEPDQVEPQFADMVARGRFKKISAAFYAPDHPANPTPGAWYLRHVGFLGALPPAVKGLKSASFAEGDAGAVEFMESWQQRSVQGLFRRLRDWMIESVGMEKADQVIPDYEIAGLDVQPESPAEIASYTEPQNTPQGDEMSAEERARLTALEAENTALRAKEAAFAERETRIAEAERAARNQAVAEFVAGLVTEGKVLPRDQAGLAAFMEDLAAERVIEFGEGEQKKSLAAPDWLRAFLSGLPKQVEFKEVAAAGESAPDLTDPHAIAARAVEFQEAERKAGREISVTAAVQHITGGAQ